jgi:hypothetical protein
VFLQLQLQPTQTCGGRIDNDKDFDRSMSVRSSNRDLVIFSDHGRSNLEDLPPLQAGGHENRFCDMTPYVGEFTLGCSNSNDGTLHDSDPLSALPNLSESNSIYTSESQLLTTTTLLYG